jgi:hypothetical protein
VALVPARAQPKKTRAAATPEEAVKLYLEAARAVDVNGVLSQLAEPERSYYQANIQLQQVQAALNGALDDKFGKDKNAPPPFTFRDFLKSIKDLRVSKKKPDGKAKVELTLWQTSGPKGEERIDEFQAAAVKEKDGWKLIFPLGQPLPPKKVAKKGPDGKEVEVYVNTTDESRAPSAEKMKYTAKTMPGYQKAMEKVTKDIKSGKYKTKAEALRAIGAATQAYYKENPPPRSEK